MVFENIILVTGKTRLQQLIERFNTKAQARFYIEHSGGDFAEYEQEHDTFRNVLDQAIRIASHNGKLKVIDRSFLPNFLFREMDVVVALGQDGLVANTAKYINGQPLIGVNPDQQRNDGILLPFTIQTFEKALTEVISGNFSSRYVTMAEAKTNDGQSLLAFNDLFVGPSSHTSARYRITLGSASEEQSSSGLIVSTGAGSTGWLSSVLNMSNGIQAAFSNNASRVSLSMKWDDERLVFAVREPFLSHHSSISLSAGFISQKRPLHVESRMPYAGVIFSDGIETDYLKFNAGCKVTIGIARQKANIVIPFKIKPEQTRHVSNKSELLKPVG